MDFALDKKYEMAQNLFREFAQNEVKPLAQEIDEQHRFPRETVEKMAKYGFLGIPVSKELGGQGCDILTYAMCVEELSKVCGTTGVIVSAHTSLCVDPIVTFGTPAQKEKYVPDLASGRKLVLILKKIVKSKLFMILQVLDMNREKSIILSGNGLRKQYRK